jgi:hypothetical protein
VGDPAPAWRTAAIAALNRQAEGQRYPTGSWAQRWLPGVCRHQRVRCIHGDEIIARRFRRRLCMICGRALAGPLPLRCWYTGDPHPAVKLGD